MSGLESRGYPSSFRKRPRALLRGSLLLAIATVGTAVATSRLAGVDGHASTVHAASPAGTTSTAVLLAPLAVAQVAEKPAAKPDGAADGDNPFPRRITAPELDRRRRVDQHGRTARTEGLARQVRAARLLDLLLHQLHAHPAGVEEARSTPIPNELVVIGVHSAKFENEQDSKNITEAVLRYEIEHPVVNDARARDLGPLSASTAGRRVLLIDPEGNVGFGRQRRDQVRPTLDAMLQAGIALLSQEGAARRDAAALRPGGRPAPRPRRCVFPARCWPTKPGGRLFIADSNHNRIVVARLDGTLVDDDRLGRRSARPTAILPSATFNHPQGMALARRHAVRGRHREPPAAQSRPASQEQVTTIAGTGQQGARLAGHRRAKRSAVAARCPSRFVGKPRKTALEQPLGPVRSTATICTSPWPARIRSGRCRSTSPRSASSPATAAKTSSTARCCPRSRIEAGFASFAQPSGLATDGKWLYVADSEGSSIRAVPFDADKRGAHRHRHGAAAGTRPAVHVRRRRRRGHERPLAASAGRRLSRRTRCTSPTPTTTRSRSSIRARRPATRIAGTGKPGRDDSPAAFDEPAGLSAAGGKLYVADTNNHLIRTIDLAQQQSRGDVRDQGTRAAKDRETGRTGRGYARFTSFVSNW